MEKESFKSTKIADKINQNFISIKVDREERADIDSVYMSVCTLLTGSGGWPLTILMTPDQKPFFAGTYFPPHNSYGRIGLHELLIKISELWKHDRITLTNSCNDIYDYLKAHENIPSPSHEPSKIILKTAVTQFVKNYDRNYGGFSDAPKFPMPHNIIYLIRYGLLEKDSYAVEMACETLIKMYQGGIYDHIGGGFSRYSTDEKWLVPHFEKMLYDNALLILAYTEGYAATKNKLFEKVIRETISYVFAELRDENNGFYCGQDADSEGIEGKYYLFTKQEILKVLGRESGDKFISCYHITEEGCYEGQNIPNLIQKPRYYMGTYTENKDIQLFETHIEDPDIKTSKQILNDYRKKRTKLHKDDKQLTSWNAMMIAALAKASHVFDDNSYLKAAEKAQEFIDRSLTTEGNKLFVSYKDGIVANTGLIDDYAYYAWSLIELYEAAYDVSYLEKACSIADQMIKAFWDSEKHGFFLYSSESENLISRPKETYDGAIPSGNSVAAYVLARLYKLTADLKWKDCLDKQLRFVCGHAQSGAVAHSFSLIAVIEALYSSTEMICTCGNENELMCLMQMVKLLKPLSLNIIIKTNENERILNRIAPFTSNYIIDPSHNSYYICENGACQKPYTNEKEVLDYFTKLQ